MGQILRIDGHPWTVAHAGVVGAAGEELTHSLELVGRIASCLEHLLQHEEPGRRVTLLDTYHTSLLQHPQDTVLALDGRSHICGVFSAIDRLLSDPQQLLAQSVLRIPALQLAGLHPCTSPEKDQPYSVQISPPNKELSLTTTTLPVQGPRQPVDTLLVFVLPRLSQHSPPFAAARRPRGLPGLAREV